MSEDAANVKAKGVEAFKAKEFEKAIEEFAKAIELSPSDHTLYGNTSACYYNLNKYEDALKSADKCIEVNPQWSKGYQRKGLALAGLDKKEEAKEVFNKGLEIEPTNQQIVDALANLDKPSEAEQNPFFNAEALAKLQADDKTKHLFSDPDFMNKFNFCKANPQMFMQLMQTDPRFMTVFQVVTGIDLQNMQGSPMQQNEQMEELKNKREAEEKKHKEEEETRKKKEEEDDLPDEEKQKLEDKKEADKEKDLGNTHYKNKDFEEALKHYQNAIDLFPTELTYYTNKAAVFFEMKEYDQCIEMCDKAAEIAQQGIYDYKKLGKAFARKGNALFKQEKYDESIAAYKKAMLENNDFSFKDALRKVEKVKKKTEDEAYIDPVKSEEHREAGNKIFKEGKFPDAIKEYDEGLRRDPNNVKIYSNRAFAYIKLMELPTALKDINKGLEIDPEFIKLWVRKGNLHFLMKEYHKALAAFDKGLKIDANNQELSQGKQKVMMAINAGSSGGDDDQERMNNAMGDPEIQELLKDYRVQSLLQEMQNDPASAQAKLKDPFLAEAINKLVAAGVLKIK